MRDETLKLEENSALGMLLPFYVSDERLMWKSSISAMCGCVELRRTAFMAPQYAS